MGKSPIEWTRGDDGSPGWSWNPVTGCTKVSAGCAHCYIERTPPFRMGHRQFVNPRGGAPTEIGSTTGVQLHPDRIAQPLARRKPTRIFVCSLADLFHDQVPDSFIASVYAVAMVADRHTFQILTKRPWRMRALVTSDEFYANVEAIARTFLPGRTAQVVNNWPPRNVWMGTSVENQAAAKLRIPHLLDTPAAVRFLSCEPLLGPLDLVLRWGGNEGRDESGTLYWGAQPALSKYRKDRIDWVLCGGESGGPESRPMHPDWARSLRDQCVEAETAFFFKQWGDWAPIGPLYADEDRDDQGPEVSEEAVMDAADWEVSEGKRVVEVDRGGTIVEGYQSGDFRTWLMVRLGKKKAGRELDGRTWDQFPRPLAVVR